jgi:hypothetical protein
VSRGESGSAEVLRLRAAALRLGRTPLRMTVFSILPVMTDLCCAPLMILDQCDIDSGLLQGANVGLGDGAVGDDFVERRGRGDQR